MDQIEQVTRVTTIHQTLQSDTPLVTRIVAIRGDFNETHVFARLLMLMHA